MPARLRRGGNRVCHGGLHRALWRFAEAQRRVRARDLAGAAPLSPTHPTWAHTIPENASGPSFRRTHPAICRPARACPAAHPDAEAALAPALPCGARRSRHQPGDNDDGQEDEAFVDGRGLPGARGAPGGELLDEDRRGLREPGWLVEPGDEGHPRERQAADARPRAEAAGARLGRGHPVKAWLLALVLALAA